MVINLTGTQRALAATGILLACGLGAYLVGTTQAHGSTPVVTLQPASGVTGANGTTSAADGITVTGTGTANGTPNELQLSLEVDTQADSVGSALDSANQDMTQVRDALSSHGVAATDLQTSGLSIQPNYANGSSTSISGYEATESLTAVLRDLGSAGQTISAATAAGGDSVRVDGVSLDLSDSGSSLLTTARGNAMSDAKAKASQYAKAARRGLGPVLSISEVTATPSPPTGQTAAGDGAARSSSPVPISAGSQQVSVTVTVVYALT
jgi:uncharacterized protein YggE